MADVVKKNDLVPSRVEVGGIDQDWTVNAASPPVVGATTEQPRMSIWSALAKRLVDHGLFAEQASKILQDYSNEDSAEAMKGRWTDDVTDYPPQLVAVVWLGLKRFAAAEVRKTTPQHWALALLDS